MKLTRAYRMTARAEAAAETARRIIEAAAELFIALDYEDVTLQAIAERAGVTLQTVLRRFGDKERLTTTVAELKRNEIRRARMPSSPGNIDEAVHLLLNSYSSLADITWRFLRQERRIPILKRTLDSARQLHRGWIEAVFAPLLPQGRARARAVRMLFAVTDFYQWKLLHIDLGLGRAEVERTMRDLVKAVLEEVS
jgi:AcrR family transcriptional regulator